MLCSNSYIACYASICASWNISEIQRSGFGSVSFFVRGGAREVLPTYICGKISHLPDIRLHFYD